MSVRHALSSGGPVSTPDGPVRFKWRGESGPVGATGLDILDEEWVLVVIPYRLPQNPVHFL